MEFKLPRWEELPDVELYLDQVLSLLDKWLNGKLAVKGKNVMTGTMVNNYVKQKIIFPPTNKKYEKRTVAALFLISFLKSVYSISDIARLIALVTEQDDMAHGYNKFCDCAERAVQKAFSEDKNEVAERETGKNKKTTGIDEKNKTIDYLMNRVADSFACQLYVLKVHLSK